VVTFDHYDCCRENAMPVLQLTGSYIYLDSSRWQLREEASEDAISSR
jgi:hypothetical protein